MRNVGKISKSRQRERVGDKGKRQTNKESETVASVAGKSFTTLISAVSARDTAGLIS